MASTKELPHFHKATIPSRLTTLHISSSTPKAFCSTSPRFASNASGSSPGPQSYPHARKRLENAFKCSSNEKRIGSRRFPNKAAEGVSPALYNLPSSLSNARAVEFGSSRHSVVFEDSPGFKKYQFTSRPRFIQNSKDSSVAWYCVLL
jgi:hypothetical protein